MTPPAEPVRLIPFPTSLRPLGGSFELPDPPTAGVPAPLDPRVSKALHELFPGLHHVAHLQPAPAIHLESAPGPAESYRLRISPEGLRISAPDAAGFFYALQTLRQIRAQNGAALPCLEIEDAPVFPLRGYYLDVSRGRVPRLEMLQRRIRLLAALKINHLQLYFEHPFRFRFDPDIAGDNDAYGADDLTALDACCREHFIELVPSFTCFGHMGRI
ncbi:MAG: glycoside hydrolase family 20 zincin-like fold domain-containing protein, partial [Kiritimatiellia bacterium]